MALPAWLSRATGAGPEPSLQTQYADSFGSSPAKEIGCEQFSFCEVKGALIQIKIACLLDQISSISPSKTQHQLKAKWQRKER